MADKAKAPDKSDYPPADKIARQQERLKKNEENQKAQDAGAALAAKFRA